jgi:hypothetical protein
MKSIKKIEIKKDMRMMKKTKKVISKKVLTPKAMFTSVNKLNLKKSKILV